MAAVKTSVKSAPASKSAAGKPKALPWSRAEISSGSSCIDLAQARQRPDPASGHLDSFRRRAARRGAVRPVEPEPARRQPSPGPVAARRDHRPRRQGKNNFYSLTDTGTDLAHVVKNLIS